MPITLHDCRRVAEAVARGDGQATDALKGQPGPWVLLGRNSPACEEATSGLLEDTDRILGKDERGCPIIGIRVHAIDGTVRRTARQ